MELIIYCIKETLSTNSLLQKQISEKEIPEFYTIMAYSQTEGRGQFGNTWFTESGKNLTFSFVLYPHFLQANEQFLLSQIISIAIKEVLTQYTSDISIKWPNDIYYREKKICGILIENQLIGKTISSCIVGVGLNVNQNQFPIDIPNPISLFQILEHRVHKKDLLTKIMEKTKYYYTLASTDEGKRKIQENYKADLFRQKGFFPFFDKKRNGTIIASIKEVTPSGILVLEMKNHEERSYFFKEVEFIFNM